MSFYICRQCASGQALRRATVVAAATSTATPSLLAQSLQSSSRRRNLFPSLFARALTSSAPKDSLIQQTRIKTSGATATKIPSASSSSSPRSRIPPPPRIRKPLLKEVHESLTPVQKVHRSLDHHIQRLHIDHLYLTFWKICATETQDFQRQIWSAAAREQDSVQDRAKDPSQPQFKDLSARRRLKYGQDARRLENFYRAFNSPARPRNSNEPPLLDSGERCPRVLQFPTLPSPSSMGSTARSKPFSGFPPTMTMHFMTGSSHPKRLLQIHQYLESVLGIEVDYYARIALLVAFSTAGDMVTVQGLFDEWRNKGRIQGGKEMYSAVIHGLVGNNSRDLTPHDHCSDTFGGAGSRSEFGMTSTTLRNGKVTQMYAALELFYDLLRRGGTPTYEIYHSLIVGMACFKNDLEAAELLLDHMLVTRKKPYVQVLHVMCREYTRQRNFAGAERIFWMLREYGIQPKPLTCNVMLKAIFQTSTVDALEYMADHPYRPNEDGALEQTQDSVQLVLNWKRQKVRELRDYMQETGTEPDSVTFSTLFYGYGHMKDGYPDLRATLVEMAKTSKVKPNLVVLSSLLFAHLNHGELQISESILDQMLLSACQGQASTPLSTFVKGQQPSPFRKVLGTRPAPIKGPSAYRTPLPLYPSKGVFHALMLAYVEHQDIDGMERILDKLIRAQHDQHNFVQDLARSSSEGIVEADLEADEFTANIMLLGYASRGDLEKAEMVQSQILSRPDWRSRHLFWEREASREELLAFVRQQGSKEQVKKAVLLSIDEPLPLTIGEKEEFDPTLELDDNIEIDVTTLAAKLKSLQKSIPAHKSSKN